MSKVHFKVHTLLYEVRRIENRILAEHWDVYKKRQKLEDRIDLLEGGLGKVALLACSLAELLLKKGIITHEELEAQFCKTDLADGIKDQSLNPQLSLPGKVMFPDQKEKLPRPKSRKRTSDSHLKRGKKSQ
jgi:hypothetical protein